MPEIKKNHPLQSLNTFGIPVYAKYYIEVESENQLPELVENRIFSENEILILGGGSNILFTRNFEGLVLHVKIKGIEITEEDKSTVFVNAGGGIEWDDFVSLSVSNNWGGIENLSAIPGYIGAAPVQNIGAYGVEVKDMIEKVTGFDIIKHQFVSFTNKECQFQYRNSIFKETLRNRLMITRVVFKLSKEPHTFATHYGNIKEQFDMMPGKNIKNLRELIIRIRKSKLPDYKVTGNAGSFFKNPLIKKETAVQLKKTYHEMPMFTDENGETKLSAAWLIDQAGCKGMRIGNAGTHAKQPLVIVNYGGASANEILKVSEYIRSAVKNKFNIILEPEVNII